MCNLHSHSCSVREYGRLLSIRSFYVPEMGCRCFSPVLKSSNASPCNAQLRRKFGLVMRSSLGGMQIPSLGKLRQPSQVFLTLDAFAPSRRHDLVCLVNQPFPAVWKALHITEAEWSRARSGNPACCQCFSEIFLADHPGFDPTCRVEAECDGIGRNPSSTLPKQGR